MKYATYRKYGDYVSDILAITIAITYGLGILAYFTLPEYKNLIEKIFLVLGISIILSSFVFEFIFAILYKFVEDPPPPEECNCCKCQKEREEEERRQREYQEWMDELAGFPTGAMCGRLRKRHDD